MYMHLQYRALPTFTVHVFLRYATHTNRSMCLSASQVQANMQSFLPLLGRYMYMDEPVQLHFNLK